MFTPAMSTPAISAPPKVQMVGKNVPGGCYCLSRMSRIFCLESSSSSLRRSQRSSLFNPWMYSALIPWLDCIDTLRPTTTTALNIDQRKNLLRSGLTWLPRRKVSDPAYPRRRFHISAKYDKTYKRGEVRQEGGNQETFRQANIDSSSSSVSWQRRQLHYTNGKLCERANAAECTRIKHTAVLAANAPKAARNEEMNSYSSRNGKYEQVLIV